MLFADYEATITDYLDTVERKMLRRVANRVIASINSKITGIYEVQQAYEVVSGSVNAETGYSYTEGELTLPDTVKRILGVYLNNEPLKKRPMEVTYDPDYADYALYSVISRNTLHIPGAETDGDIVKIEMLRNIPEVADTDSATDIQVPPQWNELLISGSLYYLASLKKYRDEVIYEDNAQKFQQELSAIEGIELYRAPLDEIEPEYRY